MSYNNSKQNKQEVNVNTRGYRFMNKDGFCPSTLLCGFWNDMISLKIHPALPESKQTASSVYDYNQMVATSLSIEKAVILIDKIETVIEPAIERGEVKSIAVLIGGNNLVHVGSGIHGEIHPFVGIHKSLDPETKKPQDSLFYEFVDSSQITIEDYNPETGGYTGSKPVQCELKTFVEILKASVSALCGAPAHSTRYVDKFYRDKVLNSVMGIGEKMGISDDNGYSGNKSGVDFGFGNKSDSNGTISVPSVNNIDDINAIDNFLD